MLMWSQEEQSTGVEHMDSWKQPEALNDAEQKFIFRVTSLYNFYAFKKHLCRIFKTVIQGDLS